MLRKKLFANIQGFAMLTVIAASGMTGGLALVLAKLSKQQMILQKRNESWSEIEALSERISRILYNNTACLNTIRNDSNDNPVTFTPGMSRVTLGHIKNNGGDDVISQNGIYGNRLIKVSSLMLENITVTGTVSKMNLQITLERISKSITGYKKTVRTYPLIANLNAANEPIDCESDLSAAIAGTRKELCIEIGGTYNGPGVTPLCSLPTANQTCPAPPDSSSPPLLPTGFDATGNLQCTALPSTSEKPHPTGYNCFLMTLYKGEHDHPYELFQPVSATAVASNYSDLSTTTVAMLERWKINDNCPTPPAPSDPWNPASDQYTCDLNVGGVDKSYTIKLCPTGYSDRFINPIGVVNDALIDLGTHNRAISGAHAAYTQHYCCR